MHLLGAHMCVSACVLGRMTAGGQVLTWGRGKGGMLGHGGDWDWGIPKCVDVLMSHRVVQIACGSQHTAVVTSYAPRLVAWSVCDDLDCLDGGMMGLV